MPAGLIANLQQYAEDIIQELNIPAVSLAIWHNNQLHQAATGILNLSTGVTATTDSIFQIGSITKVMTTSLVMQLVDEGLVNLDTPVKQYLRDFMIADAQATQSITVRQLLNHTNGIAGDFFPDDHGHEGNLLARYVDRCSMLPLVHPPSAMYSYSNSAFAVAGRLIEVVRGVNWYQAMQEHLFEPLGMKHSIADPMDMIRYRYAMGHVYDGDNTDKWVLPEKAYLTMGMAPVGSTPAMSAENLIRFGRAHMDAGNNQHGDTWLSADAVLQMQTSQMTLPKVALGAQKHAGLGWGISDYERPNGAAPLRVMGHGGGTNGFLSMLQIIPETNSAIAILTNSFRPAAIERLTNDLLNEVADIDIKQPEPISSQSIDTLKVICGEYESLDTLITVTVSDDKLLARIVYKIDPLPPLDLELRPIEEGVDKGVFAAYANDRRVPSIVFMEYDNQGVPQYLLNGGRQNPRVA